MSPCSPRSKVGMIALSALGGAERRLEETRVMAFPNKPRTIGSWKIPQRLLHPIDKSAGWPGAAGRATSANRAGECFDFAQALGLRSRPATDMAERMVRRAIGRTSAPYFAAEPTAPTVVKYEHAARLGVAGCWRRRKLLHWHPLRPDRTLLSRSH